MTGVDDFDMGPDRDPGLTIHRCSEGHAFLFAYSNCPVCGRLTSKTEGSPQANLVALTTVRVTPAGGPFRLGLAETRDGAKTLCVVDKEVDGDDADVTLYVEEGLYHAKPRG